MRSFVEDEAPVVGFDDLIENFFWLAGEGGYGIMMAPALADMTCSLLQSKVLPQALLDAGIITPGLSPKRLTNR